METSPYHGAEPKGGWGGEYPLHLEKFSCIFTFDPSKFFLNYTMALQDGPRLYSLWIRVKTKNGKKKTL